MPGLLAPPEPSLADVLRGTGQGQFGVSVFRRERIVEYRLVARLDGAAVEHFVRPFGWLMALCGGGSYELRAHRRVNWNDVGVEWDRFFGPSAFFLVGESPREVRDVDMTAPSSPEWQGPPTLVFPQRGDTVERPLGQVLGVPKLKEPLMGLTIGHEPIDGTGGSVMRSDGYFERAFLFGAPEGEDDQQFANPFAFGRGTMSSAYTMPGVVIWVNRNTATRTHLSREVLRASSGAHLDVSVLEALGKTLASLRGETQETTGHGLVLLYQVLERLLNTPLVGYQLNPVIAFKRDDDLRIEGVPTGMRLFLVGVCEAELR
jgi:hypothetical protein